MANSYKLEKDEKLIWVRHQSKVLLFTDFILLGIGIVGLYIIFHLTTLKLDSKMVEYFILVLGILLSLIILASWFSRKYILTDKKVAIKIGIIGNQYKEISFSDVQGVSLTQGFWGVVFNYGTLTISAAGVNNSIDFKSIGGVREAEQQISELSS